MLIPKNYEKKLVRRAKESHIYRDYQFTGIELSKILADEKHKALYIKLAKDMDAKHLMMLARSIAERRDIKNKGAYFMKMLKMEREDRAAKSPATSEDA